MLQHILHIYKFTQVIPDCVTAMPALWFPCNLLLSLRSSPWAFLSFVLVWKRRGGVRGCVIFISESLSWLCRAPHWKDTAKNRRWNGLWFSERPGLPGRKGEGRMVHPSDKGNLKNERKRGQGDLILLLFRVPFGVPWWTICSGFLLYKTIKQRAI